MGSDFIVVTSPSFDDHLRLEERVEYFSIKEQVAHLSVKRLAVTVLPRASGFDVECFDANIFEPLAKFSRDELRSIIRTYVFWNSVLDKKIGKDQNHILTSNAPGYKRRQALLCEFIDDV